MDAKLDAIRSAIQSQGETTQKLRARLKKVEEKPPPGNGHNLLCSGQPQGFSGTFLARMHSSHDLGDYYPNQIVQLPSNQIVQLPTTQNLFRSPYRTSYSRQPLQVTRFAVFKIAPELKITFFFLVGCIIS